MSRGAGIMRGVAEAVADEVHVDWQRAATIARTHPDRCAIASLRTIAALIAESAPRRVRRRVQEIDNSGSRARWLALAIAGVATVQILAAMAGYLAGWTSSAGSRMVHNGQVSALVLFFGAALLLICGGGRHDRRAWHLGVFFLLVASAFARPFLEWIALRLPLLTWLCPDAFLPLFLWEFVREFPRIQRFSRIEYAADTAVMVSAGAGTLLLTANVLAPLFTDDALVYVLELFGRDRNNGLYWAIVFVLLAPALPVAHLRRSMADRDERRRLGVFTWGLVLGGAPTLVLVLVEIAAPVLRPFLVEHREAAAFIVFASADTIPFTAALSVLASRVFDVRVVLRKGYRKPLARDVLAAVALLPFLFAADHIRLHSDLAVSALLVDGRTIWILIACASGVLLIATRRRLINLLDRGEAAEGAQGQAVAEAASLLSMCGSVPEIGEIVAAAMGSLARTPSVLVRESDSAGSRFIPIAGSAVALPRHSSLEAVLAADTRPAWVDPEEHGSLFPLLPEAEAQWVVDSKASAVFAAANPTGALQAMLVIGRSHDDLPVAAEQASAVAALARATGGAIDRLRKAAPRSHHEPVDPADDVAAVECISCGEVAQRPTAACLVCGGTLTATCVPAVVAGKFRIERRLGAGGMGVVYSAVDTALRRTVAIKALPRVSLEAVVRMQREARAMAAVTHANLATIFGIETWRGRPLLVVEYLGGGTLDSRLARGRLELLDALRVAIGIASGLEHIHAAGLLHRDVKPSNIGFAIDGTPKLLDFGLATLLFSSTEPDRDRGFGDSVCGGDSRAGAQVAGTLLYMAPEVIRGASAAPAADLWALAMVLFESVAGSHPMKASTSEETLALVRRGAVPSIRDSRPDVPSALVEFFDRALQPDAARRLRSAGEVKACLEAAVAEAARTIPSAIP
jgi:hypothetical protein